MSDRKPPPLFPPRAYNRCPVCGEISYSRAGAHPQCLVKQADEQRNERNKRGKSAEKSVKPASASASWQKTCPQCNALQHIRKKACSCGHEFAIRPRPPASDSESS